MTVEQPRGRADEIDPDGGERDRHDLEGSEDSVRDRGRGVTLAETEYQDYSLAHEDTDRKDPDVLLDVPVLKVDEISLEVDELQARVSLQADVLDLLTLHVGAEAFIGKVKLDIKGVEAQALLKVRLDNVAKILDRVLTTIDRNPELIAGLVQGAGRAVEQLGQGASSALGDVGWGAGSAVEGVGLGAGAAVGEVGRGAGTAVEDVGKGASTAVGEVGRGASTAAQDVGKEAGRAVQHTGESASDLAQEARTMPDAIKTTKRSRRPSGREPDAERRPR